MDRARLLDVGRLLLPVALAAGAYLALDAARFSGPFDTGYGYLQLGGFLQARVEQYGLFSLAYLPFNVVYIDEATGVVHADIATPPTPDSRCSRMHFEHGTDGSQDIVHHYVMRTGRQTTFIGMWHTHPAGEAQPSLTDEAGMANLVTPVLGGAPRALMLIAGGPTSWQPWLDGHPEDTAPDLYARVVRRHDPGTPVPPQPAAPPGTYYTVGHRNDAGHRNGHDARTWWRRWLASRP